MKKKIDFSKINDAIIKILQENGVNPEVITIGMAINTSDFNNLSWGNAKYISDNMYIISGETNGIQWSIQCGRRLTQEDLPKGGEFFSLEGDN